MEQIRKNKIAINSLVRGWENFLIINYNIDERQVLNEKK
jgi:hypothetical protein